MAGFMRGDVVRLRMNRVLLGDAVYMRGAMAVVDEPFDSPAGPHSEMLIRWVKPKRSVPDELWKVPVNWFRYDVPDLQDEKAVAAWLST